MLPDLPLLKADIKRVIDHYLQREVNRRLGVFSESPRHIVHEGEVMRVVRPDGSTDVSPLKQASAELVLDASEIPKLTATERIGKLNQLAESMAAQISEHLFQALNNTLEEAGQVVDRKGRPFDAEAIFELFETINLDFKEDGTFHPLSFAGSDEMQEALKQALARIDSDPDLSERYMRLIQKKEAEWRDREAARKLVG